MGDQVARVAAALGTPLMVWQDTVAQVAGELEDGKPAYREVFFTVPRQQGKTILVVAWLLHRCLLWSKRPQLCAYTAQTGKDARAKMLDEIVPLLYASPWKKMIETVVRANGQEAIRFVNGSQIKILPTSEEAGHGTTWSLAVLDEIWADADDRREAAFRPGMIRVPDAQLLVCSTAGTAASGAYNRKQTKGRESVTADAGRGMCYAEWSAPDGFDPTDETLWSTFMPALDEGVIVPDIIRDELHSLETPEFMRAYGNKPTSGVDMVIPEHLWNQLQAEGADPGRVLRFGVDVAEDRSSAAIVSYGGGVLEIVKAEAGTHWVIPDCNRLVAELGGTVTLDGGGPAGGFAPDIAYCTPLTGRDVQQACGAMYDAMVNQKVKFRQDTRFDKAVRGAVQRLSGDTWTWSRRGSSEDVTPLVAATMALAGEPPRRLVENVW